MGTSASRPSRARPRITATEFDRRSVAQAHDLKVAFPPPLPQRSGQLVEVGGHDVITGPTLDRHELALPSPAERASHSAADGVEVDRWSAHGAPIMPSRRAHAQA